MLRTLSSVLFLTLLAACASTVNDDYADIRQTTSTKPVVVTDEDMQKALETWRRYDMPEPPTDAPLVIWTWPGRSWLNGVEQAPWRGIGFLVSAAAGESPAVAFAGTTTVTLERMTPASLNPNDLDERELQSITVARYGDRDAPFRYSDTFGAALQFWARGHRALGRALAGSTLGKNFTTVRDCLYQPNADTVPEMAGAVAWGYWFNQAFEPGTDRLAIYERLIRAFDEFECLRPENEWLARKNPPLLAQLEAALHPPERDGEIDALTDVCMRLPDYHLAWGPILKQYLPASLKNIIVSGFEGIPLLISYLGDERLSRSTGTPSINGSTCPLTVGALAQATLGCLSNGEVSSFFTWHEDGRWGPDFGPVNQWWRRAQQQGECEYFRAVATSPSFQHGVWNMGREAAVMILGHKYPDALAEVYKAGLLLEDMISEEMASEIGQSRLPHWRKVELLTLGAGSPVVYHQWTALAALRQVDELLFVQVLVQKLDALDRRLDRKHVYTGAAMRYTELVMLTDKQAAWDALHRLARRAEPVLRLRILGQFYASRMRDRARVLGFLAQYLKDGELRKSGDDPADPNHDSSLRLGTVTIGDFAAHQIAELLNMGIEAESNWDSDDWEDLHARVNRALAAEGINPE